MIDKLLDSNIFRSAIVVDFDIFCVFTFYISGLLSLSILTQVILALVLLAVCS